MFVYHRRRRTLCRRRCVIPLSLSLAFSPLHLCLRQIWFCASPAALPITILSQSSSSAFLHTLCRTGCTGQERAATAKYSLAKRAEKGSTTLCQHLNTRMMLTWCDSTQCDLRQKSPCSACASRGYQCVPIDVPERPEWTRQSELRDQAPAQLVSPQGSHYLMSLKRSS